MSLSRHPSRSTCARLPTPGFAYVLLSFTGELLPQFQNKVFILSQPALFAEIELMLWLVIKGAGRRSLLVAGRLGRITGPRRRVPRKESKLHHSIGRRNSVVEYSYSLYPSEELP